MLALKLVTLLIALVICTLVGVRNGKRDFVPSHRSQIELFLAGVPLGIVAAALILPEQMEALYFAIAGGVFTGLVYMYTLPRHWLSLQRRLQRGKEAQNRSS